VLEAPAVDHALGVDPAGDGAVAPIVLPVELTGLVGVRVHREQAANLARQRQQPALIEPLRPAVDLDR
jgi:hypothetical protein